METREEKSVTEEESCEEGIFLDYGTPVYKNSGEYEVEEEGFNADKEDDVKGSVIEKVRDPERREDCHKSLVPEDKEDDELEALTEEKRSDTEDTLENQHHPSHVFQLRSDGKDESFPANGVSTGSNSKVDSFICEFLPYRIASEGLVSGNPGPDLIYVQQVEYDRDTETDLLIASLTDSDENYIIIEPQKQNSSLSYEEVLSGKDLAKVEHHHEQEVTGHDKAELQTWYVDDSKKRSLKPNSSDVHDIADFSKEHKGVIEQLKLELSSATKGVLPTILEEPETEELETPKVVSKLKPLKIAEHIEHLMEEIQKVYKSYSDKMRKLDILKFQTMQAYGLFELKDAIQSYTVSKSSVAAIKSAILQNLRLCKQRTAAVDPTKKVIADMYRNFEMVYVGQVCLSWEILHWQYSKVRELQIYDSQGLYQYNQVAGEFQLFQALVERFVENEPFQGPRVQNYVKNRCVLHSLLQVPLIKDDNVMGTGKRGDEGDTISIETLVDIIEGSLLVFWEFLRVDKVRSNVALEGRHHFQDLINPELLVEIQINLQKKQKTIRDILRLRNCMVKKFQKNQQDRLHQSLLLAQVNLKLVSRVLNMSKLTTDQLLWCHEKLEKVNFRNRKVLVDPSFLLFPCGDEHLLL